MTGPPTLADLIADPGELDCGAWTATTTPPCRWRSCCRATRPKPRSPDTRGGFRCLVCGSRRVDGAGGIP
jgi:hypothetical protein